MKVRPNRESEETERIIAQIVKLGEEWVKAEQDNDSAYLDALLADEWQFISTRGITVSKAEWLARPRIFPSSVRFETSDVNVKLFENTAILTGKAEIESERGSGIFRYADVFVFDSDKWRVIYSHFTPISH